uniref:Putative transposase n=1 Tax=Drosophila hydei TaxID=7224 RepID=Q24397_DROHY|nr:putative transposase [Drosophila hydei]prf//2013359A transposase [Drosophila hydei]
MSQYSMQKNFRLLQISRSLATMVRGKPISKEIRVLIRDYFKSGKTLTEISKQLNLPKSSVHGVIQIFKKNGNIENNIANRGRTSAITPRDKRQLAKIVKADRRQSLRNLASKWSQQLAKLSSESGRDKLKSIGYGFYKAKEKPLLTLRQKKKRLQWARERMSWTQRQWDTIIFSDEAKFDVSVGDTRKRVIRKRSETYHKDCLKRTTKFPASTMVWGCMSAKGLGKLHFIEGTVNAEKYINILQDSLLPSIPKLSDCGEFTFQQDGASSHTAKRTKNWLQYNQMEVLDWPSNSPDLSPIENIWWLMKNQLRNEPQRNISDLKIKLQEMWDSISQEHCKNLLSSMPKRVKCVMQAKGDVTQF